jgi:hypothetical protein
VTADWEAVSPEKALRTGAGGRRGKAKPRAPSVQTARSMQISFVAGGFSVEGDTHTNEDAFALEEDEDELGGVADLFFAVFDGHGGRRAADYACDNMLPEIMRSPYIDHSAQQVSGGAGVHFFCRYYYYCFLLLLL